jgi:hypothetical protein
LSDITFGRDMMKKEILLVMVALIGISLCWQQAASTCPPVPTQSGSSNPSHLIYMRVLAQRNIARATQLLAQANSLLPEAETHGKNVTIPQNLIKEAAGLLEKARGSLSNPIAANNFALRASRLLNEAVGILKS